MKGGCVITANKLNSRSQRATVVIVMVVGEVVSGWIGHWLGGYWSHPWVGAVVGCFAFAIGWLGWELKRAPTY